MSSNPVNIGLYGHRTQVYLRDDRVSSSGSTPNFISRLQNIEPVERFATTPIYELGHQSKIGITLQPPEFRLTMNQNISQNMKLDWILSGKNLSPAAQQQYSLVDILNTASYLRSYVDFLNQDGTQMGEQEYTGLTVSEVQYRYVINGVCAMDTTFIGTSGSFRTTGFVNGVYSSFDTTSAGAVQGKDASVYFTSGSSATTDRIYRVQSFGIRVTYPTAYVKELGKRSVVGTVADVPDISLDFDILLADAQPTAVFYTGTAAGYDYINPVAPFTAYVRLFDPAASEYGSVIRLWRVENVQVTDHTPVRSQVRGLSTARYTLTSTKETTVNTGGLYVSNTNTIA